MINYKKNLSRSARKEGSSLIRAGYGISQRVQSRYKTVPNLRLERYKYSRRAPIRNKGQMRIMRGGGNVYIMIGNTGMTLPKKKKIMRPYNPWTTV